MFDAIAKWWNSPSVFEVSQLYANTLAKCVAEREALDAEDRAEERAASQGDSLPPPERESGPDVLDGLSAGPWAHP